MILFLALFFQNSLALEFDLEKAIQSPQDYGFVLEQPALDFWAKRFPSNELKPDPEFGFSNAKNESVRFVAVGKKRLIWDVTYRFDEFGRRITWSRPKQAFDQSIIFSGCSFIFGTGLQDESTVPELIAHMRPQVKVYNAAIGASGTNQMLTWVLKKDFSQIFPEAKKLFVYVYIRDHVIRANAIYPALGWMKHTPHYEEENGSWVTHGMIAERKKWRTDFYEWVGQKFFQGNHFPEPGHSHYQYVCNLVAEAKKIHEARGAGNRFVVVEHPLSPDEEFAKCLIEKNIPLLRYPHALSADDHIPGEGHPSAQFNQTWAKRIHSDLQKYL